MALNRPERFSCACINGMYVKNTKNTNMKDKKN